MSSEDLRDAVESGDLESIRRLVEEEGVDVNTRLNNAHQNSTLNIASTSMHDNAELLRFLLENNADVYVMDCSDQTPLHAACRRRDNNIRVIQLLIALNSDINAREKYGRTALHFAIQVGADLASVRLLIDSKANVNAPDSMGDAPLHNITTDNGITAPVMELMLAHGADVHAQNGCLQTPLHRVVSCNCIEAVTVLLNHLRSIGGQDMVQSVLLACAACLSYYAVCKGLFGWNAP